MSCSLNIQLTNELRRYINERASDDDVYSTPSEYIRDLIRRDMEERGIVRHVMEGLNDFKNGQFSSKSIPDFKSKK